MVTHMRRGVFYGISQTIAFACTNASRGLSAIDEFLVICRYGHGAFLVCLEALYKVCISFVFVPMRIKKLDKLRLNFCYLRITVLLSVAVLRCRLHGVLQHPQISA